MMLCLTVISVTSIIIIESGSLSSFQSELGASARETKNMKIILTNTFLAEKYIDRVRSDMDGTVQLQSDEQIIKKATREYFTDLRSDVVTLAFFNMEEDVIASNAGAFFDLGKKELDDVVGKQKGKIVPRHANGKYYLLIFDIVDLLEQKYVLFVIRDISFLDNARRDQYVIFALVIAVSLAVLAFVISVLSKRITRPIERLTAAAGMIAQGDHSRRADITTKDEMSVLAGQFNRMADEIEKRIAMLNAQTEEKQRFINNLTHELKNPLTSIIGYANLLKTAKFDEEVFFTSVEYIRAEGKRILDLADRMFDLILYKNKTLRYSDVDLPAFFREIADIMKFKLENKSITLSIAAEPGTLRLDRELMKAALINLVDNAIKASDAGSSIVLAFTRHDPTPCISVADSGRGIPPEDIDKITEPFYRVHKTRTPEEKGIGLGLAITSEIIMLHQARLVIESELGKGTKMCVRF
jgi:signal transduction histidine kinase